MPGLATDTRRTVRQKLLRYLGAGKTGTTSSAGAATQDSLVDSNRIEQEDYWVGAQFHLTSGDIEGETSWGRSSLGTTGDIHVRPVFSVRVATSVTYEAYHKSGWEKEVFDDAIAAAIDWAKTRFLVPMFYEGTTLATSTYEYDLPFEHVIAATADSGSSTTVLTDASELTQADDYWNGSVFLITADSGTAANVGEVRIVKDSDQSDTTITLDRALPGALTTTTAYRLIRYPFAYIHRVYYKESGGEWLDLPGATKQDGWNVVPGLYQRLTVDSNALVGANQLRIMGQRYAGVPAVERDLVEVDFHILRPYVEYWLRQERARSGERGDATGDRRRAREALEEAEILLEQHIAPLEPGSRKAV